MGNFSACCNSSQSSSNRSRIQGGYLTYQATVGDETMPLPISKKSSRRYPRGNIESRMLFDEDISLQRKIQYEPSSVDQNMEENINQGQQIGDVTQSAIEKPNLHKNMQD